MILLYVLMHILYVLCVTQTYSIFFLCGLDYC